MKKMLQRSISIVMVLALCLVSMQFTTLADTVTKAGFQSLSEWIEMADDLLSNGKEYASGKPEFDAAYNTAKSMLESESASDEEITACIEDLKTAWAGLKTESVTEIAPNNGIANDTGSSLLGNSYAVSNVKQPKFTYVVNADKDFWQDVSEVYLYAYAYTTSQGTTGECISGTTLPIGIKTPSVNYIYLSACDSKSNWSHLDGGTTYLGRGVLKKFSFTNDRLTAKYSDTANLIFQLQKADSENVTATAGSLFIVHSSYEQVPVSYELYKWVNRAENLLAQGKIYTSGLDEFNAAIDAAKNATDADDVDTLIANIKTAWQALNYLDTLQIAPVGGVANDTGCANFGDYYKTAEGKKAAVKYEISSEARAVLSSATEIFVYAYGYDTASGVSETKLYDNLYQGVANPTVGFLRMCNTTWQENEYPTNGNTFNRSAVRKYVFTSLPASNSIQLALGADASASVTMVAGSMFIVKGEKTEKLPSDRIFNWIARAEKLLAMDVDFSEGIDEFNAAIEAMYNMTAQSSEDALIADLRAAWNNLKYDVTYEIGMPTIEKGADITTSYTKEDDKLGSNYVCVQSNGTKMSVRLDCDIEGGFTTDWFEDVKEIFFYTRGYQTADPTKPWSSRYTTTNANNSIWFGGTDVQLALSKFVIDKEALIKKLNGSNFKNILLNQNELKEASTWIVGSLFVTKSYNLSLADYGDVNGDGKVDAVDVVRAKKYLAGITNEIADYALDMNDDGKNAADDLTALKKVLLIGEVKFADNIVSEEEVF